MKIKGLACILEDYCNQVAETLEQDGWHPEFTGKLSSGDMAIVFSQREKDDTENNCGVIVFRPDVQNERNEGYEKVAAKLRQNCFLVREQTDIKIPESMLMVYQWKSGK